MSTFAPLDPAAADRPIRSNRTWLAIDGIGKSDQWTDIPVDVEPDDLDYRFIAGTDCVLLRDPFRTCYQRRDAVLAKLATFNPASLRCIEIGLDPIIRLLIVKPRHMEAASDGAP